MFSTGPSPIDTAFARTPYRVFWRTTGAYRHDEQSVVGVVARRALEAHLTEQGFETCAAMGEGPCPWNDREMQTGTYSRAAYVAGKTASQ